jgi:transcriptional regulator with XRE-family HTH domain
MNSAITNKSQDGFGLRFRNERIRLLYTQEQLAEKLGVRPQTVHKYEKNTTSPNVVVLYSLQDLGFNIPYLILGQNQVESIPDLSLETLTKISEMIKDLESRFPAGSLTDAGRVRMTMIFVDHYRKHSNVELGKDSGVLELLMGMPGIL